MSNRLSDLLALRSRALFAAAMVVTVLPLWLTPYLPLVDVPQHAAQVATLHELLRGNWLFASEFEVNWFTPYLTGYLILFAVSSVLPIVAATKVVLSLTVIAIPWVTGRLLSELRADERLKWLAIPASYGLAVYWGFLVYAVAVPIALFYLVLTIRFERNPTIRGGIGIAAFSILLFFCHAMALGFSSLLCLTYLLARSYRSPRRLLACALPYAVPLPIIAVWLARVSATDASTHSPIIFGSVREHLLVLFGQLSGLDGFSFLISVIIVATVLFLPLATGYRVTRKPERWLTFVVGAGVYFLFPSLAQNTAFLFQRLAVFLVPLWLLMWEPAERPSRAFGPVVLAVLALWCSVNLVRFAYFGQDAQDFASVLRAAQPGKRMAGMQICNSSPYFSNPVYLHFVAWYQAESGGVSDNSFATTHPSIVRYRDMGRARFGDQLAWEPTEFSWSRNGGDTYDYYLVCSPDDASSALFKEHLGDVSLVTRHGTWWLYENVARGGVRQLSDAAR